MPETTQIDLGGVWSLDAEGQRPALKITLPGDVHSALQEQGIIPDPYFGKNEAEVQWVAHEDWRLSRSFRLDASDLDGRWYLDLDFVDTVATVRVNGERVLEADNCFRRYRPDVSRFLVAGENTIEVLLHSPVEAGKAVHARQPFEVPWTRNSPIPYGNMLRKPQCHFGWDWNIALAPLGLYGTVKLCKLDPARIEHLTVKQRHLTNGSVELDVVLTLFAVDPCVLPVEFEFDGETVRLDCGANAGETVLHQRFVIEQPRLWWPAGSGKQELYALKVTLPGETVTRQVGLRTIELITDKDEAGSRFAFKVNGREIFCKGANWIPADALFSKTSPEKTEALLRSAVDANMNMIRVWGGGFYEHDGFYDTCDRLGLLVWQDFMFACNLYPSTPEFLDNVAAEVDYQVRRLSHHASIALWCGDNELVGALTWFEVSQKNRDRYLVSYDRLNRTIEAAAKKANPELIWWPSSPSSGYLDFGDAWHADGSGDMHFWSVWHENKSFDHYRTVKPRFCSEFGFQSYTSNLLIRRFADKKDINIASPVMEVHQKNPGGNERIAGTMFRYFRFPNNFHNFVYLSQIQQGLAIKTAVEFWRSLKPHCMGTLIWQLNDTWPVASWASLDHGGNWKAMHYQARRFFAPVSLFAIPSADGKVIDMAMVNDTPHPTEVSAEFFTVSMDGQRSPLTTARGTCRPDAASTLISLPAGSVPEGRLLAWSYSASDGSSGRGHHVNGTYKQLELEPPGLAARTVRRADGSYEITLSSKGLALFVMLEADIGGRFSDNAFDLTAGESQTILFTPAEQGAEAEFTMRDLYSCQAVD
ncbi:Beta-mannosidase [Cystobacter fuscus DSM 2262]|uniref:beta-mannosidase n=1 Tax=Cystobacter fuscus (strain ATCC 25194 / DSM 2262 / NBRC 100088 / M29) TaxID=1242864 RepID=S9PGZ6_CYSF2|nr:glycoside hydrolase family 2 protein [Cystobacter fuscus]EPX61672.1 Beta-mannosidase [Cystobacter fuscus DSM 2262]